MTFKWHHENIYCLESMQAKCLAAQLGYIRSKPSEDLTKNYILQIFFRSALKGGCCQLSPSIRWILNSPFLQVKSVKWSSPASLGRICRKAVTMAVPLPSRLLGIGHNRSRSFGFYKPVHVKWNNGQVWVTIICIVLFVQSTVKPGKTCQTARKQFTIM